MIYNTFLLYDIEYGQKLCYILKLSTFFIFLELMKQLLNKKPNEHEIPAVTVSYHSTKLGVSVVFFFLKSACFVVTKKNMLFCLIGY